MEQEIKSEDGRDFKFVGISYAYTNEDSEGAVGGERSFNMTSGSFVGSTVGGQGQEIDQSVGKKLVDEALGYAVLDSGSAATVCGIGWLRHLLRKMSARDRKSVKYQQSNTRFIFGGGLTFPSLKQATILCYLGGELGKFSVDIIDCQLPLLVGRCTAEKCGMILDFAQRRLTMGAVDVPLTLTTTGH